MEKEISSGEIGIIILFYNKVDQTINCIRSFLSSEQNIYVLNNGSDSGQIQYLKQLFAENTRVHFFDSERNLGVSGGRNYLIQQTNEEWLFSVDNDITVSPSSNWSDLFYQYISQNPEAKIICPHLFNVHENAFAEQLNIELNQNEVLLHTGNYQVTNCFPGGASIIHRTIFMKYGLFDEEMFVGFEDYEYALRAIISGKEPLSVSHIKEIELIHDHQFQKKSKDKEAVRDRYNEEKILASYLRMTKKYDIVFQHDWQWWTRKQVRDMTQKESNLSLRRFRKMFGI
jgi:GT2 family glycosyltransferase